MMERISKEEIPKLPYEGYLWYSNSKEPKVIDADFTNALLTEFPFVIEGMLFDNNSQVSIHVKNINGSYIITKFPLDTYDSSSTEKHITYINAKGLSGIKKLKFTELWREEEDKDVLGDFKFLKPIAHIFSGFKK